MSGDIEDIYNANPSTTIPNNALIYLGLSPYNTSDDSAIKWQDLNIQLNSLYLTGNVFGTRNAFGGTGAGNITLTATDCVGVGYNTLHALTTGINNVAIGSSALDEITTAGSNVAVGKGAGTNLLTGSTNTLLGHVAGQNYTGAESNNICIRNPGTVGESGVTRIGIDDGVNQTSCYIAGINGVVVTSPIIVMMNSSTGQFGTISILTSVNGGTGNGFTKFSGPTTSEKTFTLPNANDTVACLGQQNTFTKAQRVAFSTLTDAATIAIDASLSNNFNVTLGGNRTLGVPTNPVAGQSGVISIRQDITGSRTLAYSWPYVFPSGSAPILSTAALSFDQLNYMINSYSTSTVTVTIATPAVMTWTAHGLVSGQRIQLTTTGALPTGLSANTTYWITVVDANTFKLSTSLANAQSATFINTSGTQSGVHTATNFSITVTINQSLA